MDHSIQAIALTLGTAGLAALFMLYILSATLLREIAVEDLRRETLRLQAEQRRRLEELKRRGIEVDASGTPIAAAA